MEVRQAAQSLLRSASLLSRRPASQWQPLRGPSSSSAAAAGFKSRTSLSRQLSTTAILRADDDQPARPSPSWTRPRNAAAAADRPGPSSTTAPSDPSSSLFSDSLLPGESSTSPRRSPLLGPDSSSTTSAADAIPDEVQSFLQLERTDFEKKYLAPLADRAPPPMRLRPSTGRTIQVGYQVDLGRSFRMLAGLVSRNKLPQTVARQRFHERPGLKRKRVQSERWRRRFKDGFRAACRRVRELRRQGW